MDHIRYLAALTDATQAEVVDRVVAEFAPRDADDVRKGTDRAAEAVSAGDAAIAALLLGALAEAVERVSGPRPKSDELRSPGTLAGDIRGRLPRHFRAVRRR
jgi:hypothetical protein